MEIIIRDGKIANYDYIESEKVQKCLDIDYLRKLSNELEHYKEINLISDIGQYQDLSNKINTKITMMNGIQKPSNVMENHPKVKTMVPKRNNTSLLSNRRGEVAMGVLISGILMTVMMMVILLVGIYLRQ